MVCDGRHVPRAKQRMIASSSRRTPCGVVLPVLWLMVLVSLRYQTAMAELNETDLECRMRRLALHYARFLHPWRSDTDPVFQDVQNALRLSSSCPDDGDARLDDVATRIQNFPAATAATAKKAQTTLRQETGHYCLTPRCIFVEAPNSTTDPQPRYYSHPPASSPSATTSSDRDALAVALVWNVPHQTTIVFRVGIHFVGGARNWCRCDQCSYAAPWCGQHQNPPDNSDDRLISGTWMVENIFLELDFSRTRLTRRILF